MGVAEIRRLAAVCKAHLAAAARYRPKPYHGPAVLFQADAEHDRLDRRWKSALSEAVRGACARRSL